jgi:hypothetical protein
MAADKGLIEGESGSQEFRDVCHTPPDLTKFLLSTGPP